ncbi:MAG: purine-nucleoside phosphorylase [Chloroflexi bacterium]|nr:purine-nucleoside phosphorylase [Chloroflexota bacterium]
MVDTSPRRRIEEAAAALAAAIGEPPSVGIILGSGLGRLADEVSPTSTIPFEKIPHFPTTTVPGHAGALVGGDLSGKRVIMMRGRLHFYEGHSPQAVTFPVRVLAALGVRTLVVTNAAGGVGRGLGTGDIMAITDHINLPGLAGWNPLRGWQDEQGQPVFVSMQDAYDPQLRELALAVAANLGLSLRQGVYALVAGPSYETPAEVRFLKAIGADAVGMSTVGEVIVARHCGMRVLGLSCITNVVTGLTAEISHEEVLAVAGVAGLRLASLVKGFIARL